MTEVETRTSPAKRATAPLRGQHRIRWFPTVVFLVTTVAFLFLPLTGQRAFAPTDILEQGSPYRDSLERMPRTASPIQGDLVEEVLPNQISFFDSAEDGRFQLWQPLTAAGIPRGVWPTSGGYLSPFNVGYLVTPSWYAPGLHMALALLFAQWATYLFLRRLGTGVTAATLGGVAYAFAGTNLVFMFRVTAPLLMPALMWAGDRLTARPSWRRLAPVAVFVAWAWFEGFPSVFFPVVAISSLWVVYAVARGADWSPENRAATLRDVLTRTAWLAGAVIAGLLLSAIQLLPFANDIVSRGILEHRNYTADSHLPTLQFFGLIDERLLGRSQADYWSGLNPVESGSQSGTIVLLAAGIGLAIAAAGRLRLTRGQRSAWSPLAATAGVVALMCWVGTPLLGLFHQLPLLGNNPFPRLRIFTNFGLVVVAALALDAFLTRNADGTGGRRVQPSRIVSGLTLLVLLGVGVGAARPWFRAAEAAGDLRATGLVLLMGVAFAAVAAGLVVLARRVNGRATVVVASALAALLFVQLAMRYVDFIPATRVDSFFTHRPGHDAVAEIIGEDHRLTGSGLQAFPPGANAVLGLPDVRGTALRSDEFATLLRAVNPEVYDLDSLKPILDGAEWNLGSPLLDDLSVRAYTMGTGERPLGREVGPDSGWTDWHAADAEDLSSTLPAAPGPIQGIVLPLRGSGHCEDATTEVTLGSRGRELDTTARPAYDLTGQWTPFGIVGDRLAAGDPIDIEIESTSEDCEIEVGTVDVAGTPRPAVKYLVPDADQTWRLAATEQGWIYERPTAWPFVSAHPRWRAFPDQDSLLEWASTRSESERSTASYVADDPAAEPAPGPEAEESVIRDVETDGNSWSFMVEGDDRNLVVISQSLADGWTASIDGRPAEIVPVDGALMGVFVPPGRHAVELGYRPKAFVAGAAISLATALALATACIAEAVLAARRRRLTDPESPARPDPSH